MRKLKKRTKTKRRKHYERASRMRRIRFALRRIALISGIAAVPCMIGTGIWLWYIGYIQYTVETARNWVVTESSRSGLMLQNVYMEGQHYTNTDDIIKALNVNIGDPLLAIDIEAIRTRLEALNWVDYAVVTRQLPHTLHVHIVEYEPMAIWQNAKKLYLVDEKGETIVTDNIEAFKNLLVLVGDDAPLYAGSLLNMVYSQPVLAKRVRSAIRVGERRWNIRFDNGLEVKLPEDNPNDAWKFLSELQIKHKILDDNRKTVDLRIPNKVYIENIQDTEELPGKKPTRSDS